MGLHGRTLPTLGRARTAAAMILGAIGAGAIGGEYATAQYQPQPGGFSPSAPQPGMPRSPGFQQQGAGPGSRSPQPHYGVPPGTRPQSYGPPNGAQPWRGNQPGGAPGLQAPNAAPGYGAYPQMGGAPGSAPWSTPHGTRLPTSRLAGPVFRNPLAIRPAPTYDPALAARIASPTIVGSSPHWQQMQALARGGDVTQLQQSIDGQLQSNPSLGGYLSAVSAFDAAGAPDMASTYRTRALQLARQQMNAGGTQPLPWVATAQLALQGGDRQLFRTASQELMQRFPQQPEASYFAGVQAIEDGQWSSAEQLLRRAQAQGMDGESLAEMLKLAIDSQRWVWQYAQIIVIVLTVWAVGFLVLYLAGRWLSAYTLRAVTRESFEGQTSREHMVRAVYRAVINLAAVYYYVSLPLLLTVAIALPLALGYAALMLPYLNFWLVGVILVGGVAGSMTALSGLRTAMRRVDTTLPGRELRAADAPEFWKLAREVAQRVGTRPVDVIRITPHTDMAVTEHGSWLAKFRDRGQRVLIVGLGVLPGFRTDSFRSVLAHEYAHFLHRDTAGGDIAMRVRIAMERFAEAILSRGPIRRWDLAVHYLRWFHWMFVRMSLGASRLQEVLADRAAVEVYGATAFITGLRHVVRRSIEFDHLLDQAVGKALLNDAAAVGFYTPHKSIDPGNFCKIDERCRDALQQPTTALDSHPGPNDRFAAARRSNIDQPVGRDTVVQLFGPGIQLLAKELAAELDAAVRRQAGEIQAADAHMLKRVTVAIGHQPTVELLEARAAIHFRAGSFDMALHDLDQIVEAAPQDIGARMSRAHVWEAMGDAKQAARDLAVVRQLAAEFPAEQRAALLSRLGDLMAKLGKHADAARIFREALQLHSGSLHAMMGRLQAARELGELATEPMQELLRRVAREWPEESGLAELVAAGGLTDEVAQERRARRIQRPIANRTIEPPPSPALQATLYAAVAAMICVGAVGGYVVWDMATG